MIDERADSDWANLKAVAPFTGAWIEITAADEHQDQEDEVAPFTGAWIEIADIQYSKHNLLPCRTLHGCVD